LFHGRGYVQLTGRRNYTAMGKAFNVNLTNDSDAADRVLNAELAAKIMFKGMEDGTFTSKRFKDYFSGSTEKWREARRIINGLDCAEKIEGYGKEFYGAISYTTGP
jgi:putative chitinase